MKVKKFYKIHNRLAKELGEDLVFGVALDNGNYFISVSCHKSTQKFKTGRDMQTAQLTQEDLEQDVDALVDILVELYSGILYTPEEESEDNETE